LLSGCIDRVTPTTSLTGDNIISKTVAALDRVKSFSLDTDIKNTYKLVDGSSLSTTEWNGSKLISISNQEMKMKMAIPQIFSGTNMNASLDMYFKDGDEYLKTVATGLYTPNPWTKTKIDDTLWKHEIQIPFLKEIIKTAIHVSYPENERINNIDCYVLTVNPSAQAAVDLAVSQEQPFGPQIDIMNGGGIPVVRPNAFQNGSIKFWIDQKSYLPVKVEIDIDFQGFMGGGSITSTPYTPDTNLVNSGFHGQLNFSNYDQAVSFSIPTEALGIQERK
jgi:ribosomal protein L19